MQGEALSLERIASNHSCDQDNDKIDRSRLEFLEAHLIILHKIINKIDILSEYKLYNAEG
ncbi:MAG: hypothetical protein ACRCXT_16735 [Paraclostridium sp.]